MILRLEVNNTCQSLIYAEGKFLKNHYLWIYDIPKMVKLCFLPTPLAVAWVNILYFFPSSSTSPSSPSPHHQLFVSLRYKKCCGVWVYCDFWKIKPRW